MRMASVSMKAWPGNTGALMRQKVLCLRLRRARFYGGHVPRRERIGRHHLLSQPTMDYRAGDTLLWRHVVLWWKFTGIGITARRIRAFIA